MAGGPPGRAGARYGTAILSAVLLALAHPSFVPFTPRWLGLIALVPWWQRLLRDLGEGHKGPAYVFGFVHFSLGCSWIHVLHPGFPFAIGALLGLHPLLFAIVFRRVIRLGPGRAAALLPVLWIAMEQLRAVAFTGFPWLAPGHLLADTPALRNAADLGGEPLLALVVLLPNAWLALVRVNAKRAARKLPIATRWRWGLGLAALGLPLLLAGYGASRQGGGPVEPGPRVLLVQPAFPQSIKAEARGSMATSDEMVNIQRGLSIRGVMEHPDTDLVIWAETMIPGLLRAESETRPGVGHGETRRYLLSLVDPLGVGGTLDPRRPDPPTRRFLGGAVFFDRPTGKHNSLLVVGPDGVIEGRFDKQHLTPFGEYLPLVDLLPPDLQKSVVDQIAARAPFLPDLEPGASGPLEVETSAGPVTLGGLICYEIIFPELARQRVADGADILVSPANYAWYDEWAGRQIVDMARLRAVENRRAVVLATNGGPTCVIDGDGEVIASLPAGERGVLAARVPLDGRSTLWQMAGNWVGWLAVAGAFAALVAGWRRGRKSRRAVPTGAEDGADGPVETS